MFSWDRFDAELDDVLQAEAALRGPKRPCVYCGHLTTARSGVCPNCNDLPAGEPEALIEAREDT
jgi:hypothetical protein